MTLARTMGPTGSVGPIYLHPGEGRQLRVVTDLVTIKATVTQTGDVYSLIETETPPGGGAPVHTQRYDDEAFYVLEGRYTFLIGDDVIELGPGGYAFVPRGTPHGCTNTGAGTARMLVLATPGGIHEQFLEEVGDEIDRPQWEPDMASVLAVAQKYGVEFSSEEGIE